MGKYYLSYLLFLFSIQIASCQHERELLIGENLPIRGSLGIVSKNGDLILWGSSLQEKPTKFTIKTKQNVDIKIDSTSIKIGKETFLISLDSLGNIKEQIKLGGFGLGVNPMLNSNNSIHKSGNEIYLTENNILLRSGNELSRYSLPSFKKIKEPKSFLKGSGVLDYIPFYKAGYFFGEFNLKGIELGLSDSLGIRLWHNLYSPHNTARDVKSLFKVEEHSFWLFKNMKSKLNKEGDLIIVNTVLKSNGREAYPLVMKLDKNGSIIWSKMYINFNMDLFYNDISVTDDNEILITTFYGLAMKISAEGEVTWAKKFITSNLSFNNIIKSDNNIYWIGGFGKLDDEYKPLVLKLDQSGVIKGGDVFNTKPTFKSRGTMFFRGIGDDVHVISGISSAIYNEKNKGLVLLTKHIPNKKDNQLIHNIAYEDLEIDIKDVLMEIIKISND